MHVLKQISSLDRRQLYIEDCRDKLVVRFENFISLGTVLGRHGTVTLFLDQVFSELHDNGIIFNDEYSPCGRYPVPQILYEKSLGFPYVAQLRHNLGDPRHYLIWHEFGL